MAPVGSRSRRLGLLRFTVQPNGTVTDVEVKESTLRESSMPPRWRHFDNGSLSAVERDGKKIAQRAEIG